MAALAKTLSVSEALSNLYAGLKQAVSEPVPHWTDYLHQTQTPKK